MGNFENPLTKAQKKQRRAINPLILAEIGQTFNLPDYVPEVNQQLLDAFTEAQQLAASGFSPEVLDATSRLLSGDMGYMIDPAIREDYFAAQMAPAQRQFEEETLRAIAEQYAGGYAGRSGDFQGGLAKAAIGHDENTQRFMQELVLQDEIRNWEAGQNALQRLPFGIQAGTYNEMMPLNTLMNAGMMQYGLDSERMAQEAQQQIYAENPLANPLIQQWVPWSTQPYRVFAPESGGGGGGLGGMLGGLGGSLLSGVLGPFGGSLGGMLGGLL